MCIYMPKPDSHGIGLGFSGRLHVGDADAVVGWLVMLVMVCHSVGRVIGFGFPTQARDLWANLDVGIYRLRTN